MKKEVPNKGLEWTNLLLGFGLASIALMFMGAPAAAWNAGLVGLLIALCSTMALSRYGDWAEWCNLTLACWAISAPFLLGFGSVAGAMWTHVLIGLSVLTIAIMQLIGSIKARNNTPTSRRFPAE